MNPILAALLAAGFIDPDTANRINRQLDDEAGRAYAEQQLLAAFGAALRSQQGRMIDLLRTRQGRPAALELLRFWDREETLLWNGVRETILDIASERALASVIRTGEFDLWNMVNEEVIGWAETYYLDSDNEGSIPSLNLTSRIQFQRAFVEWQRGELEDVGFEEGLPALIQTLESTFGRTRATRIAVTETTRIFSESTLRAARANPFVTALRWFTVLDERVCSICGPLHDQVVGKSAPGFAANGSSFFPPAHANCRCSIVEETEATLAIPGGDASHGRS